MSLLQTLIKTMNFTRTSFSTSKSNRLLSIRALNRIVTIVLHGVRVRFARLGIGVMHGLLTSRLYRRKKRARDGAHIFEARSELVAGDHHAVGDADSRNARRLSLEVKVIHLQKKAILYFIQRRYFRGNNLCSVGFSQKGQKRYLTTRCQLFCLVTNFFVGERVRVTGVSARRYVHAR